MTTPPSISVDDLSVLPIAMLPTVITYSCEIPEWLQQCLAADPNSDTPTADVLPDRKSVV